MPWWVLELATTAVLIAIALWLGPFIKRFGRAYAADVFHDNPLTGKSYIVLMPVLGRLFSLNRRLPPGSVPRRMQADSEDDRSIYRRAADLEREADDGPR